MLSIELIKLISALLPLILKGYESIRERRRATQLDTALANSDAQQITKSLNERF
ncbi:MAG: hypothetical protein AB7E96_12150 [Deferribacterales bacterium]